MSDQSPAVQAHLKSIDAAMRGDKTAWLSLFADDAAVYDPVGPSMHDPDGQGFIGKERISAFWDMMIGPASLELHSTSRIACGPNICAASISAVNQTQGLTTEIDMVVIYELDQAGLLTSLKAYWDVAAVAEQLKAQGVEL